MAWKSEGMTLLRQWLAGPPRRSQSALAKALGTTQQTVSRWLKGEVRPPEVERRAVERATDKAVPAESWLTATERRRIARIKPLDSADTASPRSEAA